MDLPNRVSGSSSEASWLNRLIDALRARTIVSGPNYKVRMTAQGTTLDFNPGGGVAGTTVMVKQYRFKEHKEDYIMAVPFSGEALGGEGGLEKIAKPWQLRWQVQSKNVDGDVVSYTYPSTAVAHQTRIATDAGGSEIQIIVPFYSFNDIIYVAPVNHTVNLTQPYGYPTDLPFIDINVDGRAWARKYDQSS